MLLHEAQYSIEICQQQKKTKLAFSFGKICAID